MKILMVTLLLSILYLYTQAQEFSIDEFAVMVPKLNMREKPTIDSRILMTLEWGDFVYPIAMENHELRTCDTINNIYGCWWKVLHKNQPGYVFSPYLGVSYMLVYEDSHMEDIPKYKFWYGIYYDETKGSESIRKIKPRLVEFEKTKDDPRHKLLKTDQTQECLFIIGTFDSIPEKEMGIFTRYNRKELKCSEYLKPGDEDWLFFSSKDHNITSEVYTLYTTGNFTYNGNQIITSNHEVIVVGTNKKDKQQVVQNLRQYFGYKEVYTLVYTGDIDGDNKPDLIMGGSSTSSGATILFLSSRAREGELLRPVTAIEAVDEC